MKKSKALTTRPPASHAQQQKRNSLVERMNKNLTAPRVDKDISGQLSYQGNKIDTSIALMVATGTPSYELSHLICNQLLSLTPTASVATHNAALGFMHGQEPADEIEALLLAEMYAAHTLAMKFAAQVHLQTDTDITDSVVSRFHKMTRLFTEHLEALNKYRGKGQQKVTVEHVHVHDGGQAIVGNIERGGHGKNK